MGSRTHANAIQELTMERCIVLDTNCLLQSISSRSRFHRVWAAFINGEYTLCVTNDILNEYEEIIGTHISPLAAKLTIETILRANNTLRIDAQYRFGLITTDIDDNKFVDCAIIANADYIVTEDHHFDVLREIPFPKVQIKRLQDFYEELVSSDH